MYREAVQNMTDEQLEEQCLNLFETAPIKFVPRNGEPLDEAVN